MILNTSVLVGILWLVRIREKGHEVAGGEGSNELRESPAAFKGILMHEDGGLRLQNTYLRDDTP